MKCLPLELVRQIYARLDLNDIKSLRLTCHALACIGAEFLFREVFLHFRKESIKRLEAISLHSVYSVMVKSVFFQASTYGHHVFERWYSELPLHPEDRWYTSSESLAAWEFLTGVRLEQGELCESNGGYARISRAIARLPSVKKVTMLLGLPQRTKVVRGCFDLAKEHLLKCYGRGILIPMYDRHAEKYGLHGRSPFCALMDGIVLTDNPGFFDAIELGLFDFATSSSNTRHLGHRKPLRSLRLGNISISAITELDHVTLSAYQAHIAGLKELELGFWMLERQRNHVSKHLTNETIDHLIRFVTSASRLETLRLWCEWNGGYKVLYLQHLVGRMYWPTLQTLDLCRIAFTETFLLKFLTKHCSTLHTVRMKSPALQRTRHDERPWATFVRQLRNLKPWTEFSLRGNLFTIVEDVFQASHEFIGTSASRGVCGTPEKLVDDYMIRKSKNNPFLGSASVLFTQLGNTFLN